MDTQTLEKILSKYGHAPSAIIAMLQDLQAEAHYLPAEELAWLAERLGMPLSRIYRIATFYNAFSLKPRGRFPISVCLGTACHVRGAQRVLEKVRMELGVEGREVTDGGLFSVETVNCLGACALGPIVTVAEDYHGQMTPAKVGRVLKQYGWETGTDDEQD